MIGKPTMSEAETDGWVAMARNGELRRWFFESVRCSCPAHTQVHGPNYRPCTTYLKALGEAS